MTYLNANPCQKEEQQQQPHGYVARISFPPRRTADGSRISAMPVAEAQRVLAELAAAAAGGQPAPQQAPPPQPVRIPRTPSTCCLNLSDAWTFFDKFIHRQADNDAVVGPS